MTQSQKRKPAPGRDYIPVTVPFAATPTGETPGIDRWAQRAVWTDRMLATLLENKVRGGKWHTLIDKVLSKLNLFCSASKVLGKQGAAGVDRPTVADFAEHEREELLRLHTELQDGTYRPAPVRRTWIPKPGSSEKRPLGIPTVRDRVVQTALVRVVEPILDATFHERSFGFRHGRGCHDALRCVEELLEAGYVTPRKSGVSLEDILQRINRTTQGWFNYFRHCHCSVFREYDEMMRRRLRRLLLKRHRRNPEHLSRHHRWPNAYLTERGYLSLNASHVRFVQSLGNY